MAKTSEALPDYDNPPVVETVLGVQFDRLQRFTNAHLGAFWKTLDAAEWPTVTDAPPLQPQFEQFAKGTRWAGGFQLQLTQDPACRLQIRNKDGDRMIQVQNGRLHFNWLGKGGSEYPHYEKVSVEFVAVLRQFIKFLGLANVGDFRPNQWEVTYVNQIPQGSVWRTPSDWSFFKPLTAMPTIENFAQGESLSGEWHFVIPDKRGRLHVKWQHNAKLDSEVESEFIRLTFTARGPVSQSDDYLSSIVDGLDLGRATVVRTFVELMSEEANRYWSLKDASN